MLSLTGPQSTILNTDVKSGASWLFKIVENSNTHYWARKSKSYGGNLHTSRVIDFSPIQMGGSGAESGVIVPSGTTITLTSPDADPLDPDDYEGADVTISEVMKAGGVEDEIRAIGLEVTNAYQVNQTLKLECKDWLAKYLKGDWPNTPLIQDLFPSDLVNEANDNVCVPVIFGTAFIPVRPAYSTDCVYYILGPDTPTYTITKIKTPKNWPSKKEEWLNSGFDLDNSGSFYTLTGSDGNDYKATKWIICANDAAGHFPIGGKMLDVPCKYSRNDTSSMTNPANVIEYVLESFGVPSAKIDATAQTAAAAIFDGWGLTWNGGFWYQRNRMKVLSELLIQCHMRLIVRDKIYMQVLSKTSQKTLNKSYTKALVSNNQIKDQYTVSRIGAEDRKDSGYVAYCGTDDCQDVLHKALVPAKGSATDHISNDCLNMPLVHDSQHVQKLGTLAYQRKLLRHSRCTQVWKSKVQELEVCDVTTISPTDYDGPFDAEIKTMVINPDASVKTELIRYSAALDDWGDLSPGAISPATDDTTNPYSIMVSGPDSSGKTINKVKGRFWVGDTILFDSAGNGKIHVGTGLANDVAFNVHDKAYWDGSKFVIDGMVTAIEGAIGGLTLADGYLYGLASGTPTAAPNDGIVIASGNPGVIVYENTQKRVIVGSLPDGAAGVYGLRIYDDDGSTPIFELSDERKIIAGAAIGVGSEIAIQGWTHDCVFSVTDANTVAWSSGTITLMNGATYSIDAGNTGNMAAETFVYLDIGTSITVLQTTTTKATAVGLGKIMVAVCEDATDEAEFIVFGSSEANMDAGKIRANSLTSNEIAANTITASEIAAGTITAAEINIGDIFTLPSDENLVGYWSLDDGVGTVVVDNSGNGNTGTINGDPSWGAGIAAGNCLDFDQNDYVNCGGDASLRITGDRTLCAWVELSAGTYPNGATNWTIANNEFFEAYGFIWQIAGATGKQYFRTSQASAFDSQTSDTAIGNNTKRFLAVVISSGTLTFYLDGVADGGGSIDAQVISQRTFRIGMDGTQSFDGKLDEARVYNSALTANEIKALYLYPGGNQTTKISGSQITVANLSTINADCGAITAGTLSSNDWAAAAGIRLDLANKWLKMGGSNVTAAGAAAGVFLGLDTSYKFYVGDGSTKYVKFDATDVLMSGCKIPGGGDLIFIGNDSDPGVIKLQGTHTSTEIGSDAAGGLFHILPLIDDYGALQIGKESVGGNQRFTQIWHCSSDETILQSGDSSDDYNDAYLGVRGLQSQAEPYIHIWLKEKTGNTVGRYYFYYDEFVPNDDKVLNLGAAAKAWDDAYADDWNNVADFFHLDNRDDLAELKKIKGSGVIDPRTGLELIDDNTLPKWLLTKDKQGKNIQYDSDGKPYLSLKTMISLCMGAIRQLDNKIELMK